MNIVPLSVKKHKSIDEILLRQVVKTKRYSYSDPRPVHSKPEAMSESTRCSWRTFLIRGVFSLAWTTPSSTSPAAARSCPNPPSSY